MTIRIKRALAVLLLALLTLASCGLFEPRNPKPGGGTIVPCVTPNSPEDVITNIVDHYASDAGITCYTSMLDASFVFHPDPGDSNEALPDTVYVGWNRDVETRVDQNLAVNATFHQAVFDSEYAARVVSADGHTQIRFYAYHLRIRAPQSADTLYQGRADLTLFQGSDTQWRITDWADKRDGSGLRSWGYLRRLYRPAGT
jgi:hypothetical protein